MYTLIYFLTAYFIKYGLGYVFCKLFKLNNMNTFFLFDAMIVLLPVLYYIMAVS